MINTRDLKAGDQVIFNNNRVGSIVSISIYNSVSHSTSFSITFDSDYDGLLSIWIFLEDGFWSGE